MYIVSRYFFCTYASFFQYIINIQVLNILSLIISCLFIADLFSRPGLCTSLKHTVAYLFHNDKLSLL